MAHSQFVSDQIAREPDYWFETNVQWQTPLKVNDWTTKLRQDLALCSSNDVAKKILRQWRNRVMCIVAIQRLNELSTIEQEFQAISHWADALIMSAYQWLTQQHEASFGTPHDNQGLEAEMLILAMGKYGGYELNFSSDIDLIFFYSHDGMTRGGRREMENQTYFIRLGQQLIQLLNEKTADGQVFRVDMRLRPYGESGPLAMSLDAAEDYYQEQGREWERFAMIKARVINQQAKSCEQFYQLIEPFVFRRYIDYGVLESIRSMKVMIETEVRRKGLSQNIKLGTGGIREAEFIVQSLQLVRGGRLIQLREKSFITALQHLSDSKMLPEQVAKQLNNSYLYLRKVEHILQMFADQQTQLLPSESQWQVRLASAMGYSHYDEFLTDLKTHQSVIETEFANTFREAEESSTNGSSMLQLNNIHRHDIEAIFDSHSEQDIELITQQISQFIDSSAFQQLSEKGRSRLESLFPKLLEVIAKQSNAVAVLVRVLNLLRAINRRTAYLVLLEENPPILEHLVKLCSQSEWVSEQLAEYPILLDELLYPTSLYTPLNATELQQELSQQMLRIEPDDEERQQEQWRIFKQCHELRVAAAVLNKTFNIRKASSYLSQIAETVMTSVLQQAWWRLCQRHGVPTVDGANDLTVKGFSIVAYGKFGAEELGFGSDLDIVFLYDAESEQQTLGAKSISNSQFFTRLAQRVISSLNLRTVSGVLYEVDTRLRPSGNSGLLVSHKDAFADYQHSDAWVWEHQAITRARTVAGDEALALWFENLRHEIIRLEKDAGELKNAVIEMREKMRNSLDKSKQNLIDLKQGVGTMVDIEFIAQYLLLLHGRHYPEIQWSTRTTRQFIQLHELDVIVEQDSEVLIEAYRHYRELSNQCVLSGQPKRIDSELIRQYTESVSRIWNSLLLTS